MRRRGHNIAVLEGVGELASSNETARVRYISHEECAMLVSDSPQRLVVPIAGVRRGTADDETRLVDLGKRREVLVVDELRCRVKAVGE